MAEVIDSVYSTDRAGNDLLLLYFLTILVGFGISVGYAALFNQWGIELLNHLVSDLPPGAGRAIVEPWTTKLLGFVTVTSAFYLFVPDRAVDLQPYRYELGAVYGLIVGLSELLVTVYIRAPGTFTPFVWESPVFQATMVPAIFLHITTGLIVGSVWYGRINDGFQLEDLVWIPGAVVAATLVHLFWNLWVIDQSWFANLIALI